MPDPNATTLTATIATVPATRPLPDGWLWARLGDVCEFKYGASLPAQTRVEGTVPVYGSNGIVGYHNEILTDGPTIVIGRKGSIGAVHLSLVGCWPIDTTYYVDQTHVETDFTWLAYALSSLPLRELNKAAAVPGLNRDDAYAISIPLPPLAEQRRIAAILAERMAAVERARAAAEAQLAAAKALPAAELRAVFESDEAQAWPIVSVRDVSERIDYGYTASAVPTIREPLFLRITDIQDGGVDWEAVPGVTIAPEVEKSYMLKHGDIVFARTGGTTGKSYLVVGPPRAVFASYLIRISPAPSIDPQYLYLFFQSDDYWDQIRVSARGGAQPNVNATLLGEIRLPLPDLADQQRIAAMLDARMADIAQLRATLEAQLDTINALPAALLRQAFNGEM